MTETLFAYYPSPIGRITMTAEKNALTGLRFTREGEPTTYETPSRVFDETRRWLALYFAGKKPDFMPALQAAGTPFQKIVWDILCTIPHGTTVTYGDIAKEAAQRMGRERMSAQAVGGAVGRNPICLLIPCHRVIGADGSLTGYAEGLWRKKFLLELERKNHTGGR